MLNNSPRRLTHPAKIFESYPAWFASAIALILLLASCSEVGPAPGGDVPTSTAGPAETQEFTATAAPPTATPEPSAAQVNGEGIPLAEYQAELSRYQAATGAELTEDDRQRVLEDLIDQTLLAQSAVEQGYTLDPAAMQERLAQVTQQMGGDQALASWLAANYYDVTSFQAALRRSLAAAWMRDHILQALPATAEQIHAWQILLDDPDEANQVIAQLDNGVEFAELAEKYDPVTRGDLGWFPRGYLLDPVVEEAVFQLDAGQHTPVLQTAIGYLIIQVTEKNPAQPLSPDALLVVQTQAIRQWIADQRAQSEIEYLNQ